MGGLPGPHADMRAVHAAARSAAVDGRLLQFDSHRTTAEELPMTDTRTPAQVDTARRAKQQRRRVKRGIVASYIHEISERHNGAKRPAPAVLKPVEERAA
jgi:hypothetical protein